MDVVANQGEVQFPIVTSLRVFTCTYVKWTEKLKQMDAFLLLLENTGEFCPI